MTKPKGIRTNPTIGKDIGIFFLPGRMIVPTSIIFFGGFILKAFIPNLDWVTILIMITSTTVFWMLLTWQGNFNYLNQFSKYLLPHWQQQSHKHPSAQATPLLRSDNGVQKANKLGKSLIEELDLASLLTFEYEGQTVGAYLLKHNSLLSRLLGNDATDWRIIFVWACTSYHAYQTEEQFEVLQTHLDMALRELPYGEQLTLVQQFTSEDRACLAELNQDIDKTDNTTLQLLTSWEKERRKELTIQGSRKRIRLLLFATYTQEKQLLRGKDWIAVGLNSLEVASKLLWRPIKLTCTRGLRWLTGDLETHDADHLKQFLQKAHANGFFDWQAYIHQKLGITKARPLTTQECWQEIWSQLNGNTSAPADPQSLVVRSNKVSQQGKTTLDLRRFLLGRIPQDSPSAVWVAGGCHMVARCIAKPGGADSAIAVMRYLWDRLHRSRDLEVIVQLSRADAQTTRAILGYQSRRASHSATRAERMNMPDVGAEMNRRSSLEAESAILSGAGVVKTTLLIKAVAPSQREAEARLQNVCSAFPVPMVLEIDRYSAWRTWLQTLLGLTWQKLGVYGPFDHRLTMLSSEVALLLPLTMPLEE